MTSQIAIEPAHLTIVQDILARCLPSGFRAYVFGSRATGVGIKETSDLDIAVEGPSELPWTTLGRIADEFELALVPWKVDVIDLNAVSPEFRRIVDAQKVPLP